MKLNAKLNTAQIIFTSAFTATILTVVTSFVEWDKSIYTGLFAGIMAMVGAVLAKIIFKEEH
ncbi:hypothetical protein ACQKL5_02205 [Peribacillus sp. NPDC097675]|uniref:hypothetical protein n=1 Tax=Peribacillus sp. NPDC097675 TaxID=3390618 RepID=UPI003CFFD455